MEADGLQQRLPRQADIAADQQQHAGHDERRHSRPAPQLQPPLLQSAHCRAHQVFSVQAEEAVERQPRLSGVESGENLTGQLIAALPESAQLSGAIVRLVVEYPRDLEKLIDEAALREHTKSALEFHFVKRPQIDARVRLPADQSIAALSPFELLDTYWSTLHLPEDETTRLQALARQVLSDSDPTS